MSMARRYINSVWDQQQTFAAWKPSQRYELGDFGHVRNGVFYRVGNLFDADNKAKLGMPDLHDDAEDAPSQVAETFQTSGVTSKKFRIGVDAAVPINGIPVQAGLGLQLSFDSKWDVFARMLNTKTIRMSNLGRVMLQLIEKSDKPSSSDEDWWDHNSYRVVTSVTSCESFIIAMSQEAKSEVTFRAGGKGGVDELAFVDAGLDWASVSETNHVHYFIDKQEPNEKRFTPFMTLHHVQHRPVLGSYYEVFSP